MNADVNSHRNINKSDSGDVDLLAKVGGHYGSTQSIDSSIGSDIEGDGSMGSDVENDADIRNEKRSLRKSI